MLKQGCKGVLDKLRRILWLQWANHFACSLRCLSLSIEMPITVANGAKRHTPTTIRLFFPTFHSSIPTRVSVKFYSQARLQKVKKSLTCKSHIQFSSLANVFLSSSVLGLWKPLLPPSLDRRGADPREASRRIIWSEVSRTCRTPCNGSKERS